MLVVLTHVETALKIERIKQNNDKQMNMPLEHQWRYFFHFTDVRNLESICKYGLLCTNKKNAQGIEHQNIANFNIQERRANMDVPCGLGGKVHDYVPFYFSSRNPMLLGLLNRKNVDQQFIIYFCLKIEKLEQHNAVFTDASANTEIPPKFYDKPEYLNKLDWQLIDSHKWGFTDEQRHKKMAEVLIHNKVSLSDVDKIVVFNEEIKQWVDSILKQHNINITIGYDGSVGPTGKYHFYYTKFKMKGRENETLVTGPVTLNYQYRLLVESIINERKQKRNSYLFSDIKDAVTHIESNFCIIPELSGIYQLKTSNPIHCKTVSEHTLCVVTNIKNTNYYKKVDTATQSLLEFGAFLHDIGKGPKNKWINEEQPDYPDHPADAIPMLKRILVEDIEDLTDDQIRKICLLVIYHDIICDIRENERDIEQLYKILNDEDDLNVLIAITEADIFDVNLTWYQKFKYCANGFAKSVVADWKQYKENNIL